MNGRSESLLDDGIWKYSEGSGVCEHVRLIVTAIFYKAIVLFSS